MADFCSTCQRDPKRVNNSDSECSHIFCPHRRNTPVLDHASHQQARGGFGDVPTNGLPRRVSRPMTPEERKQPAAPRITRAPTCPGRFEVTGPVIGGFATLPLGQYLPEAGFSKYLEKTA